MSVDGDDSVQPGSGRGVRGLSKRMVVCMDVVCVVYGPGRYTGLPLLVSALISGAEYSHVENGVAPYFNRNRNRVSLELFYIAFFCVMHMPIPIQRPIWPPHSGICTPSYTDPAHREKARLCCRAARGALYRRIGDLDILELVLANRADGVGIWKARVRSG